MASPRIPIHGFKDPEPPPYDGLGVEIWARGQTFLQFVQNTGPHQDEIEQAFAQVDLPADLTRFFANYTRTVRVLALADPSVLEARIHVAQAERLFTWGRHIWMRIFQPADHPDLRTRLTGETEAPNPLLVLFGDNRRTLGRWGPRPQALEANADDATARRFYTKSRGRHLALELRDLLEKQTGTTPA